MDVEDDLITIAQAAERAGMSENGIRTAIFRKNLPYREFYGKKLLRPADVDHYIATVKMGRPRKDSTEESKGQAE